MSSARRRSLLLTVVATACLAACANLGGGGGGMAAKSSTGIPLGASGPHDVQPLPDKPSIAILPFDNMSQDPEQEYFADGIVEDITAALSRVRSFFVIASLISPCMVATVPSQEHFFASSKPFLMRSSSGPARSASSICLTNSSAPLASRTMSLHCFTTSRTCVPTIGLPVAMYSRPLVGLMYWVAALIAKHIMFTSNARQ